MNQINKLSSSFRDPSGFLFVKNGELLRQINKVYKSDYDLLRESRLFADLVKQNLLIHHKELPREDWWPEEAYKIIRPEFVDFISYPYEWSFGQLKDAALATLQIQKISLEHGSVLKDASAYNIQFIKGRPTLIDTLSFTKYQEGEPWTAYRQFCQHFLAPLALMVYKDLRLSQMLRVFIDGIPLDLASKLLPTKSKLNMAVLTHIHLHAKAQSSFADKGIKADKTKQMSKFSLDAFLDNLESAVKKLEIKDINTEWGDYYDFTNYSSDAFNTKKDLVAAWIKKLQPKSVWDLGANTGIFSRLASDRKINTIAFDIDQLAVNKNYQELKRNQEQNILPLYLDLTNPSPDLGWAHSERDSLSKRGPAELVMALALVHHLAISNNLPFGAIAKFLAKISQNLIIEFVPKSDSKVQKLLASREDIFHNYNQVQFAKDFSQYFDIVKTEAVKDSERILYLMKTK